MGELQSGETIDLSGVLKPWCRSREISTCLIPFPDPGCILKPWEEPGKRVQHAFSVRYNLLTVFSFQSSCLPTGILEKDVNVCSLLPAVVFDTNILSSVTLMI